MGPETADAEAADATQEGPAPLPVGPEDLWAAGFMGVLFVGSILVALLLAGTFQAQNVQVFEDPESAANPVIYLGIVVVFTVAILMVARLGFKRVIQWVILGAVFLTIAYVFEPLFSHYVPGMAATGAGGFSWAALVAGLIGAVLTVLLYTYPEWYVVDVAGVAVAAGATGIFGVSFGLFPALVLLVGFATYDFIAVYRTKHMLDLADNVLELRLPIMLVVPKVTDYSFLEGESLGGQDGASTDQPPWEVDKEPGPPHGRDALFMGLGDIVIPGVLVVSAFVFLQGRTAILDSVLGLSPHLFVALATLFGATVGFVFLMRGVLKGTAHAGLPALNGGALVAFLLSTVSLYGWSPLIPQF